MHLRTFSYLTQHIFLSAPTGHTVYLLYSHNIRRSIIDVYKRQPFIQTANATVYYPEQAQGSTRKYPIIYVQGEINEQQQKVLVSQFHQMVDENKTWPESDQAKLLFRLLSEQKYSL